MSSSKPAFVFVGAIGHTPAFFADVIGQLEGLGFDASVVTWPSCGVKENKTKWWDEVEAIKTTVKEHIDGKNQNVILVLHSYGGIPGSRAIKGLDKEARSKEGKTTGIIEVVFVAAYLVADNVSRAAFTKMPPWITMEEDRRKINELAGPILFSDLSPSEQAAWISKLEWQQNDFADEPLYDAPWELSVPKTYIMTTDDKCATFDFQFKMLGGVINNTWAVKSIKSGHEPFISQPSKMAQLLIQPSH